MSININVVEVLRESPTLMVLLFCSIILLTFLIERWWYYMKIRLNPNKFMKAIEDYLKDGKLDEAIKFCQKKRGPIPAIIGTALVNSDMEQVIVEELMMNTRLQKMVEMERFLSILGTLGNISPLIGLFGTVVGIIRAFKDLAASGSGGPAVVAAGIGEALIATAAGLIVAVPAVIAYNYFMKRLKDTSIDIDICSRKLLIILIRLKETGKC